MWREGKETKSLGSSEQVGLQVGGECGWRVEQVQCTVAGVWVAICRGMSRW